VRKYLINYLMKIRKIVDNNNPLRLCVVCTRRCANPAAEIDGLELAFGEQEVKSLVGGWGMGGRRRASGEAGAGDGGKGKKRKKDAEGGGGGGAVVEMDFCRQLLHLADVATGCPTPSSAQVIVYFYAYIFYVFFVLYLHLILFFCIFLFPMAAPRRPLLRL
jgi:hypothetical protein